MWVCGTGGSLFMPLRAAERTLHASQTEGGTHYVPRGSLRVSSYQPAAIRIHPSAAGIIGASRGGQGLQPICFAPLFLGEKK